MDLPKTLTDTQARELEKALRAHRAQQREKRKNAAGDAFKYAKELKTACAVFDAISAEDIAKHLATEYDHALITELRYARSHNSMYAPAIRIIQDVLINKGGRVGKWACDDWHTSINRLRERKSSPYKNEAVARLFEYIKPRIRALVLKANARAQEYYKESLAHPILMYVSTNAKDDVAEFLERNPEVADLGMDQPGLLLTWLSIVRQPYAIGSQLPEHISARALTRLVKIHAEGHGIERPAAWRFLTQTTHLDLTGHQSLSRLGGLLENYTLAGIPPDWPYLPRLNSHIQRNPYFTTPGEDQQAILRAIYKRCNETETDIFAHEVIPVLDWAMAVEAKLDHNQRKAGWDFFERMQIVWHTDNIVTTNIEDSMQWGDLLGETKIDGVKVVPFTSTSALRDESQVMQHCVHGYTNHCVSGGSRIFSLSFEDKRSTLQLSRQRSRWNIYQHVGKQNRSVSSERLNEAAAKLSLLYTKKWEEADVEERSRVIRFMPEDA